MLCSAVNVRKREMYTGDKDGIIKAWDYETFEQRFQIGGRDITGLGVEGHKGWVTALVYSEKMQVLFSASADGNVMIWLVRGNKPKRACVAALASPVVPIFCMAVSSSANRIACGTRFEVPPNPNLNPNPNSNPNSNPHSVSLGGCVQHRRRIAAQSEQQR